tara:strand:- start:2673 stop:4091 length:1419 start_codon:yes stop_codon:yes gene_type:complete
MAKNYQRVIHWFRRDLRLSDNTALNAACSSAKEVIPVYVISDWSGSHNWTGPPRQAFLCGCLESLQKNLERFGGLLIFRRGKADEELMRLVTETKAEAIFFNKDPDPFGRQMEQQIADACQNAGIDAIGHQDHVLHAADEILTQNGDPYRIYSPYGRNWRDREKRSPGPTAKSFQTPEGISSLDAPTLQTWKLSATTTKFLDPGEKAARERLKTALSGPLPDYGSKRDTPAGRTTSRLSQDLRFGLISVREIYSKVNQAAQNTDSADARDSFGKFIGELAWREFYMAILAHWPEVFEVEFNPQWRGLPWDEPGQAFERWCEGTTGFPIVDAGMRELNATGFMHNRVRMIVAMFLTKDLHIDWREGEKIFMQRLVDGENASNNGGWQWSAGVGADAAPYFRIQNPWTQTKRYDPAGEYIRQWVPELEKAEAKNLYTAPKPGESVFRGYPVPVVDHGEERDRCLAMFKAHKQAN